MKHYLAVLALLLLLGCVAPEEASVEKGKMIDSYEQMEDIPMEVPQPPDMPVAPSPPTNPYMEPPPEEEPPEMIKFDDVPESIEENCIGFLIGRPEELEKVQRIGAGWARPHPGPFVWGYIDKGGSYDFSFSDAYVLQAGRYNVSLLGTIWPFGEEQGEECKVSERDGMYPRNPPYDGLPLYRCKPTDIDAYKEFVKALVERYDGDGVEDAPRLTIPVKYWEVSNEPSLDMEELSFFKGSPADYVEVLKATYEAVKEACEDCKVVQGGAAGSNENVLSFWREVLELNGQEYFDIANIHYISQGDLETLNVRPFKSLLESQGVEKPIWVTEAEFREGDDVLNATKGALEEGAEKVFYVSFVVGGHGPTMPDEFAEEYVEAVGLCG